MPTPTAVAQRLYDAFAGTDGQALFDLLTDDFVGTVSTGMPHGVGGDHQGRIDMIADVWGRIASLYDMHVDPVEYLPVDDERVVVLGRYWGPPATAAHPSTPPSPMSSPRAATGSRRCSRSLTPPDGQFRRPHSGR